MSDAPKDQAEDQESDPDTPRPEPPEEGPTLDAAAAAGFGGITWADDEQADDRTAGMVADQPATAGSHGPQTGHGDDAGAAAGRTAGEAEPGSGGELSVETLVEDLERVAKERDQYLDASRRLQADFENYRKAVAKREIENRQRANEALVVALLPVLDACDGALSSGATDVEPIRTMLMDVLGKQGLDRIDDTGKPFDPGLHDAVMHEPATDGDGPVVAEVMRAGYSWKGRVVRPAMVRVRG
jgi:molecular chaperone GrpE